jgi:hypothetical protein
LAALRPSRALRERALEHPHKGRCYELLKSLCPDNSSDRLILYGTYGLDDPRDSELVSLTKRDWRLRNQAYAFSFLYKFTPQLSWGIEFRRFDTFYLQSGRQTSNHVNLGAAFSF